jgi:hypothetical protein
VEYINRGLYNVDLADEVVILQSSQFRKMPRFEHAVALIGKLGHGKTRVLNKVCGTHHASKGGCKSITQTVELGISKRHGIAFLGTPGLAPTENVAHHVAAQKFALEFTPLSGVYLVIKCGRDGDMVDDQVNDIIDMVGEEMIRIIITHADVEAKKEGFDADDVMRSVSRLAGIGADHIIVVGLDTNPEDIDDFVQSTLLPNPRKIKLQAEEVVKLAVRSQQSRRLSRAIRDIYAKIDAARQHCDDITNGANEQRIRSYAKDVTIMDIQQAVTAMVKDSKYQVFRDAMSHLTNNEQSICFAQAGASLSIKLKRFVEETNQFLSWNVTDLNDPRNHYRSCNHCGAVYVKVEGCNGATTCGLLSRTPDIKAPGNSQTYFGFDFAMAGGKWTLFSSARERLFRAAGAGRNIPSNNNGLHRKRDGALVESGCGRQIDWKSMRPVDPEVVAVLGKVETLHAGTLEDISGQRFHMDIRLQEELNRENLKREFDKAKAEGWEFVSDALDP